MKAVHEELKEIRLKKNLSLKKISEKTKIRINFLEKLEDGDYSIAPMPYVRAFFREYAENVGIEPDLVLLRLDNKIDSLFPAEIQPEALKEPEISQDIVQEIHSNEPSEIKLPSESPEKTSVINTGNEDETTQPLNVETVPEKVTAVEKNVTSTPPEPPKTAELISGTTEHPEKTAPAELEEPRSYSTLIFAVFIIIITVVALIIFFINKG